MSTCGHALGVGAAGGATKATVANVLKATRPRASGRSGGKPHKARPSVQTRHRQGARPRWSVKQARSKKLRATTDRLEIDLFFPDVGCVPFFSSNPTSGKKGRKNAREQRKLRVSPVRSSACRIAKRHERHQTPAPSCLASVTQLWELVCRPRKFCPMQTKTLHQRLATRSSRAAHSPWARPTRWAFKSLGSPTHAHLQTHPPTAVHNK